MKTRRLGGCQMTHMKADKYAKLISPYFTESIIVVTEGTWFAMNDLHSKNMLGATVMIVLESANYAMRPFDQNQSTPGVMFQK